MRIQEANFGAIIDLCYEQGFDNVLQALDTIVKQNENMHAYLAAGDYREQQRAKRLSRLIVKQNFTIAKIKEYRRKHGDVRVRKNIKKKPVKSKRRGRTV